MGSACRGEGVVLGGGFGVVELGMVVGGGGQSFAIGKVTIKV